MKSWLTRIVLVLAIPEIAYLVLVNLALNLPVTQALINQHRPERYAVYWERAWSWFPFRVHVRGVSANGQTPTQQWQTQAPAASASLAVLPLLQRTVRIYDVVAEDVDFRIRPRPRADGKYAAIRQFFPPIQDRDPDLPAVPRQTKQGRGWRVVVADAHARGRHTLWVLQVRGAIDGNVRADVIYETRGGPLTVEDGEADVALRSLTVNRDWEVSRDGSIQGRFSFAPFVPREHRGLKALAFLSVDARIDAPVDSLGFLAFYLRRINGPWVEGKGQLSGRVNYAKGDLLSGSKVAITARELTVSAAPYVVVGTGDLAISVAPEVPEKLRIAIRFGALGAFHQAKQEPLFRGERLQVVSEGPVRILPDEARVRGGGRVMVTIPAMTIPDLRAYQRYLPQRWALRVLGGDGELQGRAELSAAALRADLRLVSSNAEVAFKDYQFRTNLEVGLQASGDAAETASVDLSGTYLRLDEARLQGEGKGTSEPWQAQLAVNAGTLEFGLSEAPPGKADFSWLWRLLRGRELKTLLASADAQLDAQLSVSDLGWINLLFRNPFGLTVAGSGEVAADVRIRSGWLAQGTALQVQPQGLRVQVLDYTATGEGVATVAVEQGGEQPDMRLDARVHDALLRRQGEERAVIEQVLLGVTALAEDVAFGEKGGVTALDLRIPAAKVTDMAVYNQYLPQGSPLRLLGGEADLTADMRLRPEAAEGFVRLQTSQLETRFDEQKIAGKLAVDIKVQDGVPQDMDFDISGSSLRLDEFKVRGQQTSFDRPGWGARIDLSKARVVWKKPLRFDAEAVIQLRDSSPIVALLANQRSKHGWLEKLLTVKDVRGKAKIRIEANRLVVPYALAGSDNIDVGAKGVIDKSGREGIFYARYRKLKGILKIKNDERNFDIFGAQKKFDAYAPGKKPLVLRGFGR